MAGVSRSAIALHGSPRGDREGYWTSTLRRNASGVTADWASIASVSRSEIALHGSPRGDRPRGTLLCYVRVHLASHRELVDFSTAFAPAPITFSSSAEANASIVSVQSNPARHANYVCRSNAALMQHQRTRSCAAVRLHMPTSIVLPHARCTRAASRPTVALSR